MGVSGVYSDGKCLGFSGTVCWLFLVGGLKCLPTWKIIDGWMSNDIDVRIYWSLCMIIKNNYTSPIPYHNPQIKLKSLKTKTMEVRFGSAEM